MASKGKHKAPTILEQALREARARGKIRVRELFNEPEMLDAGTFAARIGTTVPELENRRRLKEVLALEHAEVGVRFPVWQLDQSGEVPASIKALLGILADPWTVYRFLLQCHAGLDGRTALQAIMGGQDRQVIEAAKGVADCSFS